MTTNLTNLTGSTGFYDVALFVNQETGNLFFIMFIIIIFMVLVAKFMRVGVPDAIFVGSIICFVFSMILSYIQLLPATPIFIFLTLVILSGVWLYIDRRNVAV